MASLARVIRLLRQTRTRRPRVNGNRVQAIGHRLMPVATAKAKPSSPIPMSMVRLKHSISNRARDPDSIYTVVYRYFCIGRIHLLPFQLLSLRLL